MEKKHEQAEKTVEKMSIPWRQLSACPLSIFNIVMHRRYWLSEIIIDIEEVIVTLMSQYYITS